MSRLDVLCRIFSGAIFFHPPIHIHVRNSQLFGDLFDRERVRIGAVVGGDLGVHAFQQPLVFQFPVKPEICFGACDLKTAKIYKNEVENDKILQI